MYNIIKTINEKIEEIGEIKSHIPTHSSEYRVILEKEIKLEKIKSQILELSKDEWIYLEDKQEEAMVNAIMKCTKQSSEEIINFMKSIKSRIVGNTAESQLRGLGVSCGNINLFDIYKEVGIKLQNMDRGKGLETIKILAGMYHVARFDVLLNELTDEDSLYYDLLNK